MKKNRFTVFVLTLSVLLKPIRGRSNNCLDIGLGECGYFGLSRYFSSQDKSKSAA